MPGEHHRDEHARDDVGAELTVAVVVLDRHQHVDQVPVLGLHGGLPLPLVHDLADDLHQLRPSRVAAPEALDVGVRVDEGDGVGAALQVVEQLGDVHVELLAEALPDQARGRRVDEQLGGPVEQVDLALVVPVGDHALDLGGDRRGVAPHELVAQRLVVQRPSALLGARVEHHALAEHRRHERVGLGLVQLLVAGAEEDLVGLGAGEQHHVLVGQAELADVAALGAHALHQPDRVGAQLLEVAGAAVVAGDLGRVGDGGHVSPWVTGASGCTSSTA